MKAKKHCRNTSTAVSTFEPRKEHLTVRLRTSTRQKMTELAERLGLRGDSAAAGRVLEDWAAGNPLPPKA